jgi:DNA repair protein SbcC/Rad50
MLSWLYKNGGLPGAPKKSAAVAATPPPGSAPSAPTPPPRDPLQAAKKAETRLKQAEEARAAWAPRLQAAQGDDDALLRVAESAPLLEIKLAAVEALVGEDALKQAERRFRSHDRKVHSVAKARLETVVTTREHRARANAVIEAASALSSAPLLPANQLVALDRDWQALDARLLEDSQNSAFTELRERLNAMVRERGEQEQRLQRWTVQAQPLLGDLRLACTQVADSGDAAALEPLVQAAQALLTARVDAPATAVLARALETALQTAAQVQARLAWLAELQATPLEGAPDVAPAPPVDDADIALRLGQRFELWQHAQRPPAPAEPVPQRSPRVVDKAAIAERRSRLEARLLRAETELAEGHLAGLPPQLQSLDATLATLDGLGPHDPLRARHQALHSEYARLKGWQQWGGGRARDDLVAQAEKLALATAPTAAPTTAPTTAPGIPPEIPPETAPATASPAAAPRARTPKLNLKQHGDAIAALRKRWKELDRLGAAASQALWLRFDAALTIAHQPVAVQQAALKVQREENLAAREALLAALEAVPVDVSTSGADDPSAFWKEQQRALEQFERAWRSLGPVEHTVPVAARAGLLERLRHATERVETPLNEARRAAEGGREQLITHAEALVQELAAQPQLRDAIARVRDLQAQWQHQARSVPLKRGAENALWARFKAATDAVFGQREAAAHARDAELAANLAQREALLARLTGLRSDTPRADIERTLAEVDRAWRAPTELPRGAIGPLEARLRDAHAAALGCLAASASVQWRASCDALLSKLELCERNEAEPAEDLTLRWGALPVLPPAWERAMTQRRSATPAPAALAPTAVNDLLLQLETALDLPATPERLAARRDMKLRALKDALEGRATSTLEPARRAEGLVALLRQRGLDADQCARLHALVAALRDAAPGTLVAPAAKG